MDRTDKGQIPEKLKKKYAFLWKQREDMTPSERRWKWVKPESYPQELKDILNMGEKKK